MREAELARANGEITALQAKWIEQRLALAQEVASTEALRRMLPELQPWLATNTPPLRLETAQAYAQSWLQFEASRRQTAGLEVSLAALIDQKVEMTLALATNQPATRNSILIEARLNACKSQLEETQKKLAEARLEPPRLRAMLEAMTNTWSELGRLSSSMLSLANLPADLGQRAASSSTRVWSAALLIDALHGELQAGQVKVTNRMDALLQSQRAASRAFKLAKERWAAEKRRNVLGLSCVWLTGFLVVLLILSAIVTTISRAHFRRSVVFGGALAALAVLYAYQMYQMLGGAAMGILLVLVLGAIGSGRRSIAASSTQTSSQESAGASAAKAGP